MENNEDDYLWNIFSTLVSESNRTAFRSEGQICGFIVGRFEQPDQNVIINREIPTPLKYKSKEGELFEDPCGTFGHIDLQIVRNNKKIYIELEYPRGTGREIVNFSNHLKRDIQKLESFSDAEYRFVLIFDYKDYENFDFKDTIKQTIEAGKRTRVIHIRLPYKDKGHEIRNWKERIWEPPS